MNTELQRIDELARAALGRFGLDREASVELCNVSENHTYRVDDPGTGARFALRVHRPGYHNPREIESELSWMMRSAPTASCRPPACPRDRRRRVVSVATPDSGERNVVLFEWLTGAEPDLDSGEAAAAQFQTLGAVSARMHEHARSWPRPAEFTASWDYDGTLGSNGHWGAWQDGLGIGRRGAPAARTSRRDHRRAAARVRSGRAALRTRPCRIRLANLLIDGDHVRVIDFDDCGFSWYMYDFATTVSFIEDHPRVPELRDCLAPGISLGDGARPRDEAELATFVMLRRLLLVAWIGSHHTFATEAAELGAGFTVGTCALAEDYLTTHSPQ